MDYTVAEIKNIIREAEEAAADVLKHYGFTAYVGSRLD